MYSTSINTTFSYINFNFCSEWCLSVDSCGLANLNNQWVAKNDVDSGSVEEMTDDNGAITGIQWTSSSDVQCDTDPEQNFSVRNMVTCPNNAARESGYYSAYKNGCVHELRIVHEAGCPLTTVVDETDTSTIE